MKTRRWQLIGVAFAIITGLLACIPYRHGNPEIFKMIFYFPFVPLFIISLWLSVGGESSFQRKMILWSLIIGFIIGWLAFIAGYFGPIFLSNSSQGPLLGIFFTGPLGLSMGLIIGIPLSFIIEALRKKRQIIHSD